MRQGDLLSPLLFLIMMEVFNKIMKRAKGAGLLRGFRADGSRGEGVCVSHLLFVDDTILVCDADEEQILNVRMLLCFQAVTGLKVNTPKSEIVPIGEVPNVHVLAEILGCPIESLPMTYLGMPLGASFKSPTVWNPILERTERKLAEWKKMYLSKGGRLTLLKSTLSSLPTYFLSLFTIPTHVANKIERLQRDFLWGDSKTHLVGWDKVCAPLECGGLGVRKLTTFNKAFLEKWLWRFGIEETRLLKRVVALKFGEDWGGWTSKLGRGVHGCGLWRSIRVGWEASSKNIRFEVGVGDRVKLWIDQWCGESLLQLSFPNVFGMASNKQASVASSLERLGIEERRSWDVHFIRRPNDWKMGGVDDFLRTLGSNLPPTENGDRMGWKLTKNGDFDVLSFYNKLRSPLPITFP